VGNYNSQYESYYSKFSGNRRGYNPYAANYHSNSRSGTRKLDGNYLIKRLLRELIGVFIMFMSVFVCKTIVTPQTTAVYNYSKSIVNTNYDYTYLLSKIKSINISNIDDLQQRIQESIETLKVRVSGGQTIKEKTKSNFIAPVSGEVILDDGKNGIEIAAQEGSKVVVVCDGTIKEAGENQELGKYILIDHGDGIESRYCYLSSIEVKQGSQVKKGDIAGKSGNSHKTANPSLHFDLYYMGETVSPTEYIDFKSN
jgi:murein DD-endopeptidase MepM/ murein hydrolase activator NlpD